MSKTKTKFVCIGAIASLAVILQGCGGAATCEIEGIGQQCIPTLSGACCDAGRAQAASMKDRTSPAFIKATTEANVACNNADDIAANLKCFNENIEKKMAHLGVHFLADLPGTTMAAVCGLAGGALAMFVAMSLQTRRRCLSQGPLLA